MSYHSLWRACHRFCDFAAPTHFWELSSRIGSYDCHLGGEWSGSIKKNKPWDVSGVFSLSLNTVHCVHRGSLWTNKSFCEDEQSWCWRQPLTTQWRHSVVTAAGCVFDYHWTQLGWRWLVTSWQWYPPEACCGYEQCTRWPRPPTPFPRAYGDASLSCRIACGPGIPPNVGSLLGQHVHRWHSIHTIFDQHLSIDRSCLSELIYHTGSFFLPRWCRHFVGHFDKWGK